MSGRTYVVAFESTHAAMAAYRALADIKPAMIPTPKDISAGCGMSLRFEAGSESAALEVVEGVEQIRGLASLYEEENRSYRLMRVL